jgi:hypothetical protein
MANTFKFGNGNWAVKDGSALAYNDENNNFKPLPFDFTRASSATRVNKQGLIETVPSGKPRIDFLDNTSGHLLLEPSRANLATYSEGFSNWSIISRGVVVTDNTTDVLSPSGKNDASKVEFNAASKILGQSPTLSGNYSGFVYVKGTQGETIRFNFAGTEENFTLTGGWDKLERTNITATANAFNLNTYGGATARTIYVYGAQLEAGSYATSYIPTEGSSETRVAEVANGAGNSTVFNDSEGVLYVEISALANDGTSRRISISAGNNNNNNLVSLIYGTSNKISPSIYSNGNFQMGGDYTLSDQTQKIKVALKYSSNDAALWVNGVEVLTDDIVTTPIGLNQIKFEYGNGSNDFYGKCKDLRVYNTALTDTELQNLTT